MSNPTFPGQQHKSETFVLKAFELGLCLIVTLGLGLLVPWAAALGGGLLCGLVLVLARRFGLNRSSYLKSFVRKLHNKTRYFSGTKPDPLHLNDQGLKNKPIEQGPPSSAPLLPLYDLESNVIVDVDGRFCRGFELFGIDSQHLSEQALVPLQAAFYGAFSELLEGTRLQFLSSFDEDDALLHRYAQAEGQGLLKEQTRRRKAFLQSQKPRAHRHWVFVQSSPWVGFEALNPTEAIYQRKLTELDKLTRPVAQAFSSLGCVLRPLDQAGAWSVLYRFCGGQGFNKEYTRAVGQSPRQQLLPGELSDSPKGVCLGDVHHQVLSLVQLPEAQTHFPQAEVWQSLGCTYRVSFHLEAPRQGPLKTRLGQSRRFAAAAASAGKYVQDPAKMERFSEASQLLGHLESSSQQLMFVGAQVAVWGATEAEVKDKAERVRAQLRKRGLRFELETGMHAEELFKMGPGMGAGFDRKLLVTSNVAADLIPALSHPAGDSEPQVVLQRPSGELFGLDPWQRTPPGILILGASGSGKSVFTNLVLLECFLKRDIPVMVVDVAGEGLSSYLRLSQLFGGAHLPLFDRRADVSINPFLPTRLAKDESGKLRPDVLTFLTRFLDLLLENTESGKDSALYRGILQGAIEYSYQNLDPDEAPTLDTLKESLKELQRREVADFDRVKKLLDLLEGVLAHPTARLFNRSTNVTISHPFVIFDLHGIKALSASMQAALVLLVVHYINSRAYGQKGKKAIVLDEVAQLLSVPGGSFGDVLQEAFATIRKHAGIPIAVTQTWTDYSKAGLSQSLANNCGLQVFLSHASAGAVRDVIAKELSFDPRERALFEQLQTLKGKYSQMLLRTDLKTPQGTKRVSAKLQLQLSPFDLQLFTTAPEDRDLQYRLKKNNPGRSWADVLGAIADGRVQTRGKKS